MINSITAIDDGIDFIDATITGMGRGAGNLKMELLLTYLNKHHGLNVDFNVLGNIITTFTPLLENINGEQICHTCFLEQIIFHKKKLWIG